jgi:glycosyltransferase involved in cell wall biosynthesis
MNVLHINQSDIAGGAAIAANRLHRGLQKNNINSRMLVGHAKSQSKYVDSLISHPVLNLLLNTLGYLIGLNYINILNTFKIPNHKFFKEADVINLHNLHAGYFNYLALPKLSRKKAILFTLHDMWSFTGHCAYSMECERWKNGCGKCPYPKTYPEIRIDNTYLEWKIKNWIYRNCSFTIVTPSKWLANLARESMLKDFPIHHIPYGIDTEEFKPLEYQQCRHILGIPNDINVMMYCAYSLIDPRKGGDELFKILDKIPNSLKKNSMLLTIGNSAEGLSELIDIKTLNLGFVGGDKLKTIAYSSADLLIFPTIADNLPLTLQESMACGTPMISYDVGGVSELVRHGITGYLSKYKDRTDFCNGIKSLLEDKTLRDKLSHNCRTIALEEYGMELQIDRYIELYNNIIIQSAL